MLVGLNISKIFKDFFQQLSDLTRQPSTRNDTEDLENRVFVLEFEMDIVQSDMIILYDDVGELRNQDSLTDLRLTTIEEIISRNYLYLNLLAISQFKVNKSFLKGINHLRIVYVKLKVPLH